MVQANGSTDLGWSDNEPAWTTPPGWIDEADCSELDTLIEDEIWISEEPWSEVSVSISLGKITFH